MKKKLLFAVSLTVMLVCLFALSVNAACAEHTDSWTISFGEDGYLGQITAVNACSQCGTTIETEVIDPLFVTLGYSYGSAGGITQHYAVDRAAVARYEELSGEKVKFGAVAATKSNVEANPLDKNGMPVNEKVKAVDFTDTGYDLFDVMVNNIPQSYHDSAEIFCCAYIMAGNEITYIENGVEKKNAVANTFTRVTEKVDGGEEDKPEINQIQIINKVKYKILSLEDLSLKKWSFWQSDGNNYNTLQTGTGSTNQKFFATRKFDKAELPNGTMIIVESGWQYRPEGWINGGKNNGENASSKPRPKTTSESVVVDDAWWGDFTERAFNITPGKAIPSTTTAEEIYEIFKIYVPLVVVDTPSTDVPVIPDVPDIPTDTPTEPDDPVVDTEKQAWDEDGALKILCIGNSFSTDSMEYVYQVAQAAGVKNIVLGNLYIGGCSLDTHLDNAKNNKGSYTYFVNTNGTWSSPGNRTISAIATSEDWDFISLQQVSGYSGVSESYASLDELIEIVEPLNPSARLVWHMTWAYQQNSSHSDFSRYNKDQMTMYNAIVNAVKTNIVPNEKIDIIIPAGTAIQNVRTSYVGDTLTRDGYHLSYDYGRYIGSLTFVKALTGLSIDNMTYAPNGVTENRVLVAIEAVNNAIAKPFEVTKSSYEEEPEIEVPDAPVVDGVITIPEGYRQLTLAEMGWQSCSYWNGSSFSHKTNDAFSTGYYGTTNSFTREQIPVGSIIILKQGENRQYRPDGWGGSGSRPGNVTAEKVIVDETWWSGYKNRGFNVSKTNHSQSNTVAINSYTPEEIWQVLVILVPDTTGGGTGEGDTTNPDQGGTTTNPTEGLIKSELCVEQVTTIDGVEYRALTAEAMGITLETFYWSEKIANERYELDESMAKKFFSTKVFERDELIDGTLIWVADGWQYRPEGWQGTSLNSAGSRPSNQTTAATVSSTWWGDYTTRAFNISLRSSSELVASGYDTIEEVYEVFKIYIPVDKIAE